MKPGDVVSPEMLHRMLAQLADPLTGQAARPAPGPRQQGPGGRLRPDVLTRRNRSRSCGPWATQATRAAASRRSCPKALGEVIAWAEDHVFFTRTGAQGARQESVRGVVASTWLHYESRDGDCPGPSPRRGLEPSPGRLRRALAHPGRQGPPPLGGGPVRAPRRPGRGPHDANVSGWPGERPGPSPAGWPNARVEGVAPDLVAEFSRRTLAIEDVMAKKAAEARGGHAAGP